MSRSVSAQDGSTELGALLKHNVRLDRIDYRAVSDLHGYKRRLRKRSEASVEALRNAVAQFGIVTPILVDAEATIIDGHGIVEAARSLGYSEVPTLTIDHLTESEVRVLRLALNRLGEDTKWDSIELKAEFEELLALDLDFSLDASGFAAVEIDNVILGTDASQDDADDVVDPPSGPQVTKLEDVWILGGHRILCGSSLDPANLERLMDGVLASAVFTDSPFNVVVQGNVSGHGKTKHREFAEASGEMSEAQFIEFQCKSTTTLSSFCLTGAVLFLCMDWRHMWEMMHGIRAAGLNLINVAIWVKRSGGLGSLYRSQHEMVFVARKGKSGINNVQLGRHGRNRTNCWFYPGVNSFGAERDQQIASHPTPKNVSMVADAIRDVTNRGDIVLDGFLGSGTTLIAAERTGRICYGIDIDPLYIDGTIRRWEKATGQQARLLGTNETFAEVALHRSNVPQSVHIDPPARRRAQA